MRKESTKETFVVIVTDLYKDL